MNISEAGLKAIEGHFHALIRKRAGELIDEHGTELPRLNIPLNSAEEKKWFAVPGFYGGFSYWFETGGDGVRLVTESWSRVWGGSGQRHVITEEGFELVDEGFV